MKNNFTILFLLFVTNCFSQINAFTEEIELPNCLSCDQIKDSNYTELDDSEASKIIEDILELTGFPKVFSIMQCEGAENAFATTINEERFIIYSKEFFNNITNSQGSYSWENVSILAHEIGHHVYGHSKDCNSLSLSKEQQRKMELEADKFMGIAMKRMGASLLQATAAINNLVPFEKDDTYSSHPSKSKRLNAIEQGYNDEGTQKYLINLGEANLYKAIDFYKSGDYRKANEFLSAVVIFGIENDLVYSYKGKTNFAIKNYNDALIDFDKAISFNPNSSQLYVERAKTKNKIDEYDLGAIKDLYKAQELDPLNPYIYMLRGQIGSLILENGYDGWKQVIDDFDKAVEINPEYFDAYYEKAYFIHFGYDTLGSELFDEGSVLEIFNSDELNYFNIGLESISKAINLRPEKYKLGKAFNLKGKILNNSRDYDKNFNSDNSISSFTRCLDIEPINYNCQYGIATTKYYDFIMGISSENLAAIKELEKYFKILEAEIDNLYELRTYASEDIYYEDAIYMLANLHGFNSDWDKSIEVLDKGIDIVYDDFSLFYLRAMARESIKDYYGSVSDYSRASELEPDRSALSYNLGRLKSDNLKDYDGAIINYLNTIKVDKYMLEAYLETARNYIILNDYEKSLEYAQKGIDSYYSNDEDNYWKIYNYFGPPLPKLFKVKSDYYLNKNQYNKAIIEIDKSLDLLYQNLDSQEYKDEQEEYNPVEPTLGNYLFLKSRIYWEQFKDTDDWSYFDLADDFVNKSLNYEKNDSEIYFFRANINVMNGKKFDGMLDLQKAAEVDPTKSKAYLQLAQYREIDKQYDEAIYYYNKAIQVDSTSKSFYYRGLLKYKLKDYQGAIEDYNSALVLDNDSNEEWYDKEKAWVFEAKGLAFEKLDKYYDAIYNYKLGVEYINNFIEKGEKRMYRVNVSPDISIDAGKAILIHNIGKAKFLLKDYLGASKDFRQALEIVPNMRLYYYNLGVALIRSGKDGCDYIDKAKELGLYDPDYLEDNDLVEKEEFIDCDK